MDSSQLPDHLSSAQKKKKESPLLLQTSIVQISLLPLLENATPPTGACLSVPPSSTPGESGTQKSPVVLCSSLLIQSRSQRQPKDHRTNSAGTLIKCMSCVFDFN